MSALPQDDVVLPRLVVHRIEEIWQERPGEWSGRCACGMVHKHQPYGPVRLLCESD